MALRNPEEWQTDEGYRKAMAALEVRHGVASDVRDLRRGLTTKE